MKKQQRVGKPVYPRKCLRCGYGPYIPRRPGSVKCPRCNMNYNEEPVRKTKNSYPEA